MHYAESLKLNKFVSLLQKLVVAFNFCLRSLAHTKMNHWQIFLHSATTVSFHHRGAFIIYEVFPTIESNKQLYRLKSGVLVNNISGSSSRAFECFRISLENWARGHIFVGLPRAERCPPSEKGHDAARRLMKVRIKLTH